MLKYPTKPEAKSTAKPKVSAESLKGLQTSIEHLEKAAIRPPVRRSGLDVAKLDAALKKSLETKQEVHLTCKVRGAEFVLALQALEDGKGTQRACLWHAATLSGHKDHDRVLKVLETDGVMTKLADGQYVLADLADKLARNKVTGAPTQPYHVTMDRLGDLVRGIESSFGAANVAQRAPSDLD